MGEISCSVYAVRDASGRWSLAVADTTEAATGDRGAMEEGRDCNVSSSRRPDRLLSSPCSSRCVCAVARAACMDADNVNSRLWGDPGDARPLEVSEAGEFPVASEIYTGVAAFVVAAADGGWRDATSGSEDGAGATE